ncbi:SCP-like extracellular protein [Oceanobacillus piezotolerans]|uniref:SCP-like extracellular protein n=1 Tax=Oceanobacillus piezotolerans TaxID=2448030 RepID=A0A498D8R7_9BACI|nr:CAP domain-containing protein [Oceanobacillus piezotolerans]RLL46793.1 SCP-like extracellular protein [Oceanobacillus piezotolerans]
MKRYIILFVISIAISLSACGAPNTPEVNQDSPTTSSLRTNAPSTYYPQTQSPDHQGEGFGNNFRPISMETEQAPNQELRNNFPNTYNYQQNQPEIDQENENTNGLKEMEYQVVELTNEERQQAGLNLLEIDYTLSSVAREKSRDMHANRYFSHESPTYGSPFDMMAGFGVTYRSAGENIAMGQRSAEQVVDDWMNSEGHRANIMNGGYTHIGVGYIEDGNYWTQMFIRK